jgi:hypothetical protein
MFFKNNSVKPEQTAIASSLFLTTVSKNYDGGSPTSVNGTDGLSFPRTTSIPYTSTQATKAGEEFIVKNPYKVYGRAMKPLNP